jgi:hypothetical protein
MFYDATPSVSANRDSRFATAQNIPRIFLKRSYVVNNITALLATAPNVSRDKWAAKASAWRPDPVRKSSFENLTKSMGASASK